MFLPQLTGCQRWNSTVSVLLHYSVTLGLQPQVLSFSLIQVPSYAVIILDKITA